MNNPRTLVKPTVAALTRSFIRTGLTERTNYLRLDKNENFELMPCSAFEELRKSLSQEMLSAYPDLSTVYRKVAKLADVCEERVYLSAGSDLAIKSLYDTFLEPGDEVVVHAPFYFMYEIYARQAGAEIIQIPVTDSWVPDYRSMLARTGPRTKLMIIEDPSGFVGARLDEPSMKHLATALANRGVLLLIDEAYLYVGSNESRNLPLLDLGNVVLSRTLSKAHGLAGARVGFILAAANLIAEVAKTRPLYELSALSAWAAEWCLDHPEILAAHRARSAATKATIIKYLVAHDIEHRDTDANFFLMRLGTHASALADAFKRCGILVRRPFDERLISGWTRVTVPPANKCNQFLAALDVVVAELNNNNHVTERSD